MYIYMSYVYIYIYISYVYTVYISYVYTVYISYVYIHMCITNNYNLNWHRKSSLVTKTWYNTNDTRLLITTKRTSSQQNCGVETSKPPDIAYQQQLYTLSAMSH